MPYINNNWSLKEFKDELKKRNKQCVKSTTDQSGMCVPPSDPVSSSFVAGLFDKIFVPAYEFDYRMFVIPNLTVMYALCSEC